MAKSMKSKQKMKIRNEKRKRYYVRELNNLKKLVENREARREAGNIINWNYAPEKTDLMQTDCKLGEQPPNANEQMDTEEKPKKIYGKNFRDKDGNFPAWMNSKQKHKLRVKSKKIKTKKLNNKRKRI
ncbi:18 kDa learning-associated protein of slug-like [Argonauta hians]